MKSATLKLCPIALVAASALFTFSAHAELDYEFGKTLMERDEPSFNTDDLVEHLVSQLDQKADTKMDAKLIKATLRMRQALASSLEKRKSLLDEAEALYREILAGDKKYKHYDVAEKEASTMNSKRATTMIRAAQELEKTNPAEARKMRQEAVATMEKISGAAKAVADEKFAKLKPHYDKYKEWNEKVNTTGDKPIPPEILKPLGMNFDDWLLADKRYVATKIEQLECYDDSDGGKKSAGADIAKLLKARTDDPMLGDFPVIVAWYNYMLGRTYSAIQDEKQAGEAWNEALLVDMGEMQPPQKKAMFILKKGILHDLVKMKMKAKKYSDVEGIVVEAIVDPGLRTLFDEDSGKELLIDYAKALTLPNDATSAEYEKAIKKLRELIVVETKNGQVSRWANDYTRTIAEILDDARKNKPNAKPKLSAPEWYDAARGFFLMGQQAYLKYNEVPKEDTTKRKDAFEKAYIEYQNAVDYYRRAVAEARKPKTDLLTRVTVEPKAWFEMALCYLKMEHYYEAIIAYQAMRDSYLPESRKKWMPDVNKVPELRKIGKAVNETLAELDKPTEGLNAKSGKNIVYALDKNMEIHKNKDDFWNKRKKSEMMGEDPSIIAGEKNVTDPQYQLAKTDMEMAKSFNDSAKTIKDPKQAEEIYAQVEAKYLAAATKFSAVKPGVAAYELAMYQTGSAYTMVQALWATGRFPGRAAETKKQCSDLAKKAVDAFDKYDSVLKTTKPEADDDKQRREKLAGTVLLARNALQSGAGEWEAVIKTADEYLAWETVAQANGQLPKSSADVAYLNKFRAQIELASDNIVPKCDVYLAGAEATMRAWRKEKPKENKLYVAMIEALSRRNNIAAFQVEKFVKEGKSEYNSGMTDKYENKVADLQSERVGMKEDAEDQEPSMEDYGRLVYLFNKTRRDKQCADISKKLLEKFDPEKKNARIPDDEKLWQEKLTKLQQVVHYNELNKDGRCKKDHMVLIDYMYDTTAGVNAGSIDKRPDYDKYNSDMDRARIQLETIKKNYPDCQTLDKKYGEDVGKERKSLLGVIEEEIDFRRKIMATRELLFEKSIKIANVYEKEGNADEAKRYKEVAFAQLDILIDKKGETPELLTMKSNIAISIGNFAEALDTLNKVRIEADQESVVFFDASKKMSEVYALQKKWSEAREYPEFFALTVGFDAQRVRERWPDMKIFLKECYDNGAPMPPGMKKLLDTDQKAEDPKADPAKTDEKKPDDKKEEAPKADEKKVDAKDKKEEPKKDDAAKADK